MNQLKPMLLTSLKNYNRFPVRQRRNCGNYCCDYSTSAFHRTCTCLRCRTGSRYFYRHCCRICHLSPWWKQRSDCRTNRCFCNHCRGDRCQKWNGRTDHCNHPCRSFSDPDGTLPLRKSDQIYSIYDHNRFYLRNRSDDRDRTVKRLLRYFLPRRSQTDRDHRETKGFL